MLITSGIENFFIQGYEILHIQNTSFFYRFWIDIHSIFIVQKSLVSLIVFHKSKTFFFVIFIFFLSEIFSLTLSIVFLKDVFCNQVSEKNLSEKKSKS